MPSLPCLSLRSLHLFLLGTAGRANAFVGMGFGLLQSSALDIALRFAELRRTTIDPGVLAFCIVRLGFRASSSGTQREHSRE